MVIEQPVEVGRGGHTCVDGRALERTRPLSRVLGDGARRLEQRGHPPRVVDGHRHDPGRRQPRSTPPDDRLEGRPACSHEARHPGDRHHEHQVEVGRIGRQGESIADHDANALDIGAAHAGELRECGVRLDRGHRRPGVRERAGQRATAGTQLQHPHARSHMKRRQEPVAGGGQLDPLRLLGGEQGEVIVATRSAWPPRPPP